MLLSFLAVTVIVLVLALVLFRGDDYVEMDINVHKFGSVPKKALEILIGRLLLDRFIALLDFIQ